MKTKTIEVTLEKAREWYNSDNNALKEIALRAFLEEELKEVPFTEIKTFTDVCKALSIADFSEEQDDVPSTIEEWHAIAVFKLDLIRKALNGHWKPKFEENLIFIPHIKVILQEETVATALPPEFVVSGVFIADGIVYSLIGGDYYRYSDTGLCCFDCGRGFVDPISGLLSCKSYKIAAHMSKYFAKEIFEATYLHYTNYKWL